ncbi:MAG TPA: glycosyl hydrolase family 18 protein [Bacillota bacterium]|mgnify:FL=1|nr:glycosyl hydrolase family 18 protein [Bacillota bacterium]
MESSNPGSPDLKPAPQPGRKRTGIKFLPAVLPLIAAAAVLLYLAPGFFSTPWGEGTILVVGCEKIGAGKVMLANEQIFIDVETLQLHIDPHLFWDEAEQTAVITTADRVIHMYSDKLTAEVNLRPVELRFPLHSDGKTLFLPLLFLADFYDLAVNYHPETGTVVVDRADAPAFRASIVSRSVRLREGPGLNRSYLALLKEGDLVRIEGTDEGRWVLVRTASGMTGYLPRKSILLQGPYPLPEKPAREEERPAKKIPPPPLVMTWEDAYSKPSVDTIPMMPSLQIVSPTWFDLLDREGNMSNLATPAYINWARQRGYLIWPRVTNSFDREIAAAVLSSSALRRKVINQLLIYARLYKLDGLNLDFENFHYTYGHHYTQFVRELAPLCAEEGLVLSVAVSMVSEEPYWSKGYDRGALAEAADYIALMAYDEHWGSSPVAGSVASLPWVEQGIQRVLEEVPAHKLILGVPFYTRVWQLASAGGDESLFSKAFSMKHCRNP